MTDYLVTMESAWIVRDVKSLDDAIGIAISEAGKRLNPAAKYVEIEAGKAGCPYCEESLNCGLVVANTGLVGLVLEMKVFRAESEEHAQRIAKSTIGKALGDVPLKLLETKALAERKGSETATSARPAPSARSAGSDRPTGQGHPFRRPGPGSAGRRPAKR